MNKYVRGKLLGRGSFGCAILVTDKASGKQYVVKEISVDRMPPHEKVAAKQEAELLKALKHPNIVSCRESFIESGKLCIVMDYCSEGDLHAILARRRGVTLPEATILDWFVQIALALKHVHDRKILHRDIKTQNIFVAANGLLKLGDFGVSKVLNSTHALAATGVGTPYYLSPEICQNRRYNAKSDVWSAGCVLYELACGRHAFAGANIRALISKIVRGVYTPIPNRYSNDLRSLVDGMLQTDPTKRLSIYQVLKKPIITARIQKFLTNTGLHREFSHTVIHGQPRPGNLVVQAPTVDMSAVQKTVLPPIFGQAPQAAKFAPVAKPKPALNPLAPLEPGPFAPGRGFARAAPQLVGPVEAPQAHQQPGGAAGHAAARAQVDMQARLARIEREKEELKLQRQKLAAENARLQARAGAEQRARQQERALAAAAMERDKREAQDRAREAAAERRAQAAAEQQMELRKAREVFRQQQREQAKLMRDEFAARQAAALRNKAAVEEDGGSVAIFVPSKPPPKPLAVDARVAFRAAPHLQEQINGANRNVQAVEPVTPGGELTPAQRRQVYLDMRAQAAKNRLAAEAAEKRAGGLAHFLGVPERTEDSVPEFCPTHKWMPPEETQVVAARSDTPIPAACPVHPSAVVAAQDTSQHSRVALQQASQQTEQQPRLQTPIQQARSSNGRDAPCDRAEQGACPEAARPERQQWAAPALPTELPWAAGTAMSTMGPLQTQEDWLNEYHRLRNERKAREAAAHEADAACQRQGQAAILCAGPAADIALQPMQPSQSAAPQSEQGPKQRRRRGWELQPDRPEWAGLPPLERKKLKLEAEREARELEIRAFQQANLRQMREAAARNKKAVLEQMGNLRSARSGVQIDLDGGTPAERPSGGNDQPQTGTAVADADAKASTSIAVEDDGEEYAAMLKDMVDAVEDESDDAEGRNPDGGDTDTDDAASVDENARNGADAHDACGRTKDRVKTGCFMLGHEQVLLPVNEEDSLAQKVEALRIYLEQKLGTVPFLNLYQRMESLETGDDPAAVAEELCTSAGHNAVSYIPLVHQLIVTEEVMHASAGGV